MEDEQLEAEEEAWPTAEELATAAAAYIEAWTLEVERGEKLAMLLESRDEISMIYEDFVLRSRLTVYGIDAERHLKVYAIAEKLREGVVLEESAYVYLDPNRDSCRIVFPRLPGHGEYAAETVHVPSRITDETGQRVTVTVTKVEP